VPRLVLRLVHRLVRLRLVGPPARLVSFEEDHMATNKFPGPSINTLIDEDPSIVKVPLDHAEFGARKSLTPKDIRNNMTIVHTGKEQGPGRNPANIAKVGS
jgi:hypothetical protein